MGKTQDEHWLDKHIVEQQEQRAIIDAVCDPFEAADLCEIITEQNE